MQNSNKLSESYKIMHVVEAFGAGVGHSIHQIFTGYTPDIPGIVVHGERDFNASLCENASNMQFVKWAAQRELSLMGDFKALTELIRIMRKHKPTLVHAHSSKGGVHGRIAAFLVGIPCVYTPHSYAFLREDVSRSNKFLYKLIERILSKFALTIACGIEEYSYAKELSKNVTIVENGINVERFSPRLDVESKNGSITFLCVGRISPQKDYPFFESLSRLSEFANHNFVWVSGEGVAEQQVTPNLKVLGARTPLQMAEIYRSSDCFISTSLWEGLSRATLEAAASGLPLLLRECPGNRELIFRLPAVQSFCDLSGAKEALIYLIKSINKSQQYGVENSTAARRFYSSVGVQARIRSIYDSIAFNRLVFQKL